MEKIKALWGKLNLKTTFIGGILVITTAIGTCTFAPNLGQAPMEVSTEETTEIEEVVTLEDVDVEVIEETTEAEEAE